MQAIEFSPTLRGAVSVKTRKAQVSLQRPSLVQAKMKVQLPTQIKSNVLSNRQSVSSAFTPSVRLSRRNEIPICMASAAATAAESSSSGGGVADFFAVVRAIAFYLTTVVIAVPLFHLMLLLYAPVMLFDKFKRTAMHMVNDIWANLTTLFFYPIEVKGKENLPAFGEGVVFVANHQSYLDIFSLFRLHRPFKFVSKSSIFLFPIVGWSMFLTGHVGLKRTDRRSQMACLQDCRKLLQKGSSVLFFPEGTRSTSGEMASFKKGAFSVAAKDEVPVVPVTIVGTGKLMQNGKEGLLRSGGVTLIVHPTLKSKNAAELCQQSEAVISEELKKYDYLI